MNKSKNFILLLALLVNTSQLFSQSSPDSLIADAWRAMPFDLKKADSLSYQLLEVVTDNHSTSDQLYANTFFLLGTLEIHKKRYRISADFYERAMKTDFIQKNKSSRLKCLNNMGASLSYLGKIPEALQTYQEALELSKELNDQTSIEYLWINIADLESDLGEYKEAITLATKALEAMEKKSDSLNMAKCYLNLGKYFIFQEIYEEGKKNTLKALQFSEQLNDRNLLSSALINLSELEQLKGKYEASNQLLQRVVDISKEKPENINLSPVYCQLAENAITTGIDIHKAQGYCLEAIRLAELSGTRDHLEEAILVLSKYYSKVNDFNNFSRTIDRYNKTKRETVNLNAKAASEELKIIYNTEQLTSENRNLQLTVRSKNNQLLLSLFGFLVASLIGAVIFWQHWKLKQNMKTMFQMNLSLAYSRQAPPDIADAPDTFPPDNESELSDSELYLFILRRIEKRELYKNPQFGIQDLVKHVKRNRKYVTSAIRNAGKTTFAGLINEFKVNEARRLIMEQGGEMPMGDIALAAGFNSRISFNRHFKEFTGFTPTDYLNMIQKTAVTKKDWEEEEEQED
jgi:tetratricopeptide (TPR) repeat protein/AraC-like DNA-binding protein